jgi:arylsulfatase A-like enzyme
LDYKTGSILDAIDDLKIREDTIVIWTSDNGADFSKAPDTVGSAGFWRGGSGSGFTTCKDPKEAPGSRMNLLDCLRSFAGFVCASELSRKALRLSCE